MDFDDMANRSLNTTFRSDDSNKIHAYQVVDAYVSLLTTIGGIADILIIFCVMRFNKMQIVRNMIIMNWAFADFLVQLFQHSKIRLILSWFHTSFYNGLFCIYHESDATYLNTLLIFIFILSVNFVYRRINSTNFKYVAGTIWGLSILVHLALITLCACRIYIPLHFLSLLGISVIVASSYVIKLCVYSIRRIQRKEKRTKLRYILTSVFGITWILAAFLLFINELLYFVNYLYMQFIAYTLCYSNPFVNIFLLTRYDKNFRMCFLYIFRRSSADYVDSAISYDNDDENDDPMIVPSNTNVINE